ncbi:SH3 domain-containing protein [Xanthobacteraceae bacterium A53D]
MSNGQQVWLRREGAPSTGWQGSAGPAPSACSVYYGQSNRCAAAHDLAVPRLLPGQSVTVRVVYPANVRQSPSFSAPILTLLPLNTCVVADSCGLEADGRGWCRIRYNGGTGYMTKQIERDGRRTILFSNSCGGG